MGSKIKQAREARGWGQHELAEAIGVEPATISRWENGIHSPRAALVPKIAKALGRPTEWFQQSVPEDRLSELEAKIRAMEALSKHIGVPLETLTPPAAGPQIPASILECWNQTPQPVKLLASFLITGRRVFLQELEHSYPSAVEHSKSILEAHKGLLKVPT
jgi:transcriptional regulator with XRE-family HTH domain